MAYLIRSAILARAARAHSSSNWPPGAPLTPIPPMICCRRPWDELAVRACLVDVDLASKGSPNAELARVRVGTDDPNGQPAYAAAAEAHPAVSLAACGCETRSQIIWAKNNFAIGRGH